MDDIKIRLLCVIILEKTRRLSNIEKQRLEHFTDKIYLTRNRDDNNLFEKRTLMEFKRNSIDMLSLRKVSNLHFDEASQTFLLKLYQDSNEDAGFRKHFEERITEAIDIVRNI